MVKNVIQYLAQVHGLTIVNVSINFRESFHSFVAFVILDLSFAEPCSSRLLTGVLFPVAAVKSDDDFLNPIQVSAVARFDCLPVLHVDVSCCLLDAGGAESVRQPH